MSDCSYAFRMLLTAGFIVVVSVVWPGIVVHRHPEPAKAPRAAQIIAALMVLACAVSVVVILCSIAAGIWSCGR